MIKVCITAGAILCLDLSLSCNYTTVLLCKKAYDLVCLSVLIYFKYTVFVLHKQIQKTILFRHNQELR